MADFPGDPCALRLPRRDRAARPDYTATNSRASRKPADHCEKISTL
jgi:hypothetical protein